MRISAGSLFRTGSIWACASGRFISSLGSKLSLVGGLAAGCAGAVFVAGALLFSRGFIGGGDVKLLTAATLWAGPSLTPALLIVTGLLGGVLTIVLVAPLAMGVRRLMRHPHGGLGPVPYGVAIAAAALIVTCPQTSTGTASNARTHSDPLCRRPYAGRRHRDAGAVLAGAARPRWPRRGRRSALWRRRNRYSSRAAPSLAARSSSRRISPGNWPEGGIGRNYIQAGTRTIEAFAGWVARDPFVPGEPVTEAKIVSPGSRGFLAAVLAPGMRAVSVPVTATSGISGFVFPGDQVDILVSDPLPAIGQWQCDPTKSRRDGIARRSRDRGRPEARKQERRGDRSS